MTNQSKNGGSASPDSHAHIGRTGSHAELRDRRVARRRGPGRFGRTRLVCRRLTWPVARLRGVSRSQLHKLLGTKITRSPFDPVVIGTIGRQKVQDKASTPFPQRTVRDLAGMNTMVIHDQMNDTCFGITIGQLGQEGDCMVDTPSGVKAAPLIQQHLRGSLMVLGRSSGPRRTQFPDHADVTRLTL